MPTKKPIRIFWSELSNRFYATRSYREIRPGIIEVTGNKTDVTDDIARLVMEHDITFAKSLNLPLQPEESHAK